ncbi:MAG: PEP-CTERM sorting domain-containing protein [Tepidisphaeraceae bacterium]|jgi:hypothetical protein
MRTAKRKCIFGVGILSVAGLVGYSRANVISWEEDRYGTVTPTQFAGVVSVDNWTDSWPSNPTTNLPDNTGAATTLDIAPFTPVGNWSIQGSHPGLDADGTANKEMLNGYLNGGPATWNPNPPNDGVVLTNIPYSSYNLYVYISSDQPGRTGFVTDGTVTQGGSANGDATVSTFLPNGATTYDFSTIGPGEISGADALFAQTTDAYPGSYPAADYAVFSGLTGSSQTVTLQMLVNDGWAGVAGFQVVQVPEPVSLGSLLAIGSVLAMRRRARC